MPNYSGTGAGGGGAGFHGKVIVTETADYVITVGSGGVSRAGFQGTAEAGGTTYISKTDTTPWLSAGGGNGGNSWVNGGSGGAGGILTNNFTVVETYVSRNGNNGGGGTKVYNAGADGPISGHTWGKSGWVSPGYAGGVVGSSCHGYVMIKYVGPLPEMYTFTINPTPSDAIVTLTVDGTIYNQNSISVRNGKTVSWSVSKEGYTTQTGTATVTQDTTLSIELEEHTEPLYYCYYYSGFGMYYYAAPTNLTTVYGSNTWGQRVSSSSELNMNNPVTATDASPSSINLGGAIAVRDTTGDLYT